LIGLKNGYGMTSLMKRGCFWFSGKWRFFAFCWLWEVRSGYSGFWFLL